MQIDNKAEFYKAIGHLDQAPHTNRAQDHKVMQLTISMTEAARRQREAIKAKDWARVDIENSYLASLAEQLEAVEREEGLRHEADASLWWAARPFITYREGA